MTYPRIRGSRSPALARNAVPRASSRPVSPCRGENLQREGLNPAVKQATPSREGASARLRSGVRFVSKPRARRSHREENQMGEQSSIRVIAARADRIFGRCSGERRPCEREFTRRVQRVLDSTEPLNERRREIVREHLAAREECPVCRGTGTSWFASDQVCERCEGAAEVGLYCYQLGDRLKEWCEELVGLDTAAFQGTGPSSLAVEVLTAGLALVEWNELAVNYVEEECGG